MWHYFYNDRFLGYERMHFLRIYVSLGKDEGNVYLKMNLTLP